ncbi:mannose-1-phosphate guanylyltransferase/mannose-6-phosphate isomerase [Castellaniella sp.]|uniref:mannose-1-phosphate guanylyltransferase/mannose-6-phosphate isomerase n=1 Tax=Castellaniella sp. TaxID=1955812 RepID=UPI003A94C068
MSVIPVILSGGSGTRLWPLSRQRMPKQFLALTGDKTLFQATLRRLEGVHDVSDPIVVCHEDHRFIVAEQLRQIGQSHQGIMLEPTPRNTAPAIAVSALQAQRVTGGDPVLLVLPADHVIEDLPALRRAVEVARQQAEQGALVTFGVVPTEANTGYGYIRAARAKSSDAYPIQQFVEKPNQETAQHYVDSGEYFWNSGMFMFRASRFLEELAKHQPEILSACKAAFTEASGDLDFVRLDHDHFAESPADSIDYAIMEKTDQAVVVPLDAAWSDVGSWSALWAIGQKDEADNVLVGDVVSSGASGCYARSDHRLLTLIDVQDLVVVDTLDAVMVARRDHDQNVKTVVGMLNEAKRPEAVIHREVYRPWGKYDSIDMGGRFQVKRITIKPGARLSIQKHHHRAEHWIVVSGTAEVTCDEKKFLLSENQSTYIPLGSVHCLGNPGKIPLEIIEVQSGSYLGEDDIVRLQDNYGRA